MNMYVYIHVRGLHAVSRVHMYNCILVLIYTYINILLSYFHNIYILCYTVDQAVVGVQLSSDGNWLLSQAQDGSLCCTAVGCPEPTLRLQAPSYVYITSSNG